MHTHTHMHTGNSLSIVTDVCVAIQAFRHYVHSLFTHCDASKVSRCRPLQKMGGLTQQQQYSHKRQVYNCTKLKPDRRGKGFCTALKQRVWIYPLVTKQKMLQKKKKSEKPGTP